MRIVVLGGSGMLGHKLFQVLRESFDDVWCTVRERRANSALRRLPLFGGNDVIWGVDAAAWGELLTILNSFAPDVVVNAVGVVKQRPEAENVCLSTELNALLPHRLTRWSEANGARCVSFSTDCVFSGTKGEYSEKDVPDAVDLYGKTKALGEVASSASVVTLRSSIIGRELRYHQSLLDWFLAHREDDVPGFRRVMYSGITTLEMARVVKRILVEWDQIHGLYQVASETISKYDLLKMVAEEFQTGTVITPVDEPRLDRSLVACRLYEATGYTAPAWQTMVSEMVADQTPYDDWAVRLRSADRERVETML